MNEEATKIIQMSALGAIGGVVRLCGDGTITTWRMMAASVLVSLFAGGVTAAFLHDVIKDPVYLGGVCSVGGYMGQVMIVLLEKRVRRVIEAVMR